MEAPINRLIKESKTYQGGCEQELKFRVSVQLIENGQLTLFIESQDSLRSALRPILDFWRQLTYIAQVELREDKEEVSDFFSQATQFKGRNLSSSARSVSTS